VCLLGGLLRRGWGRVLGANKVGRYRMYGKITLGLGVGLDFGEKFREGGGGWGLGAGIPYVEVGRLKVLSLVRQEIFWMRGGG